MSKLSITATNIAREEARGDAGTRARLRRTLHEVERIPIPETAWSDLPKEQRRGLIAYLLDDAAIYPAHRAANVVCLAMLLRAEKGQQP